MPRIIIGLSILLMIISCQPQSKTVGQIRYIVTSPEVAEILAAIGASDNIVGVTEECNYPPNLAGIENIGNFGKVDFERIIEIDPTLVFTSGLEQEALSAELQKLNIPVQKIYPQSLEQLLKSIADIGRLTDREKAAEILIDSLETELKKIEKIPISHTPKVYVEIYGEPLMSVNNTSFVGEIITLAGGENIFSELPREYSRINTEHVIESNPEIIILTYPGIGIEEVVQRKGWEVISAVQNNKIFSSDNINPDLILRASPRCIEGIKQLQKAFYE